MTQTLAGPPTLHVVPTTGRALPEPVWSEWLSESLCQLASRLRDQVRFCRTDDEVWSRCGELLSVFTGFAVLGRLRETTSTNAPPEWTYEPLGQSKGRLDDNDLRSLRPRLESVLEPGPTSHRFRFNDTHDLVLVPADTQSGRRQVLLAGVKVSNADAAFLTVAIQTAASAISMRTAELAARRHEVDCAAIAAVVELVQRVQGFRSLTAATKQVAEELRRSLGCSLVVIGEAAHVGAGCHIVGQSGDIPAACRADFADLVTAVMDETLLNGHAAQWPPTDENAPGLLVHRQLAERGSIRLVTTPLQSPAGGWEGSCLCVFAHDTSSTVAPSTAPNPAGVIDATSLDRPRRLLDVAAEPLAVALAQLRHIEGRGLRRWMLSLERSLSAGGRHFTWMALAACAALMLVPVPHPVECRCEVQPVQRRFVAAPFEGKLERALVEPGDTVKAGQLIATLDGREVRWELAGLMADQGRLAKERDGHRAKHDFPAAALSELELKRNDLKIKLLEHRSDNLEIRSPVDGLILAGDLRKAEGMPLKLGQTLFEIAPPGGMIVEAAVPEESLPYLTPGQRVTVRLESLPGHTLTGTLTKIDPQSERRYDDFAFVSDVELTETNDELRPGMHGHCTIDAGHCQLGWRLFHRLWESVWLRLGW